MSISTFHQADLKRAWGGLPAALLSVVAALAAVAAVAVFFWPNDIDPEVRATLRYVGAGQQQTTSGIKAINDSLAAERRDLKMLSDQFLALAARQSTLQDDATRILRNNAELAERLKATETQMAQDNASVAEQLKALTQMMARRPGVLAMGSEERERSHRTTRRKLMPEVGRPEMPSALAARRPAGALFPAFQAPLQR